ncbi:UDP-glucose/GDP-mannose dehydrogenase family protein [Halobacillus salinarum]|uniref:UDP-glucose 6-dehydrogenase n=1 Tax=Halobacillus salinarum TaxID=2932257 RepID=A0ABY4EMU7_9BACI|nr:UDP-glucose/GDP-mannose dehydrogenase family protein [Halobacillus salinarum]UOQ45705.1 UDP-glucose/GDP-mannose dehydrogenase family protein [Halobacillus salinarum]
MKISVIGTGYVGLVTGVCLSETGHEVTCLDIDEKKVQSMRNGISPIYEPGLDEMMKRNIEENRLFFTSSYEEGLADKEFVFIAVGTPQSKDGSADLQYLNNACRSIAESIQNDVIVITKSTVPVGTNEHVKRTIESHMSRDFSISVVSNPEFLREGSAIHDTFHGDRIVIGSEDEESLERVKKIYQSFELPILTTDLRSAEMIKYASNAFLATKISFINELGNLCERLGANIENVAKGMGMDQRIGSKFLNAGVGYGGSCFPKDTNALLSIGNSVEYNMSIIQSVIDTNEKQQRIIVDKIKQFIPDLTNKKVGVLGLAFKPNTDDMRDAPSIKVIRELVDSGADVYAYDPIAAENARIYLPGATVYRESIDETLQDMDFAVIMTDWKQIKEYPLDQFRTQLKNPVVFDGRNCFPLAEAASHGLQYHSIGRPSVGLDL